MSIKAHAESFASLYGMPMAAFFLSHIWFFFNDILKDTYNIVPDLEGVYSLTEEIIFYLHITSGKQPRALYVCSVFQIKNYRNSEKGKIILGYRNF